MSDLTPTAYRRVVRYFSALELGSTWMVIAAFNFALMGLFIKWGSKSFPTYELLFYRTFVGLIFLTGIMLARKKTIRTVYFKDHLMRGLAGYLSLNLFFYTITYLPLGTATTLNYTSSLFFSLLCVWRLKSRLTAFQWLGIGGGLFGIVLLLQPSFTAGTELAALLGLISGMLAGLAIFEVNQMGKKGEDSARIVFWFFFTCTLINGIFIVTIKGFTSVSWETVSPLLLIGLTGLLGQLSMTQAYQKGQAFLVSSLAYLTVVFSLLLGVIFLGDALSWLDILAILLIIVCGVLSSRP